MELSAIYHESDSRYSYPLGGTAFKIILETKKGDDIASVACLWNSYCHFYKERTTTPMRLEGSDHLHDYYSCVIDNGDPAYSYIFLIKGKTGKELFYSETGFAKAYSFATSFLDEFMATFPNPLDVVEDNKAFEGRLFYQIFPERFAIGSNEGKKAYVNQAWDSKNPNNLKFCGGDFKGIEEKIPYLKSLGVGAIYLTPIHPSPSAHKYDVNDYMDTDPMFGSKEDFKHLVAKAHEADIKVVMDMVFNHCCFYNNLFQDVVKRGKESPYYNWFFVEGDKPSWDKKNYLTFADVRMMPKLNTNNPEVMEYLCKVGEFWIDLADVDGYRLDVAFEVSHAFWRMFKGRMRKKKKDFILIGEHWLNAESRLSKGEWDSVMNYPFRYALERFYAKGGYSASWLSEELTGLLFRYPENTDRMMLNLLDSHDIARFNNYVSFDRTKIISAFALTIFFPGWPELYMGDEIFMKGGSDPDNRKCMEWDSKEFASDDGTMFKNICLLRKKDAFIKGDYSLGAKDGYFFITRHYEKETYTLYINNSGKSISFSPENPVFSKGLERDGRLGGNSFAITRF